MRVNWDNIHTLVLMTQFRPEPGYYLLEGEAANEVVEALKENTEATAKPYFTLQMEGSGIKARAISQDGSPEYCFYLNYQWVEGLGNKRDRDTDRDDRLLAGQEARFESVVALITTKGVAIPAERFEEYSRDFEQIDWTWLWWKN